MDKLWTAALAALGAAWIAYDWGRRDGMIEGRRQTLDAIDVYFKVKAAMNDHQNNNNNNDEKAEEESQ